MGRIDAETGWVVGHEDGAVVFLADNEIVAALGRRDSKGTIYRFPLPEGSPAAELVGMRARYEVWIEAPMFRLVVEDFLYIPLEF